MVEPGRQPAEGHTPAVEQLQVLEAERASVNGVLNALEDLFGKEPEKGFRWFHLCKVLSSINGSLTSFTFARHAARVAAFTFALVGGSSAMEAPLAQLCGQLEASAKSPTG